ncbi:MAG: DNA mismatch endonuclease Vsr [Egibacteraceae bacterium]
MLDRVAGLEGTTARRGTERGYPDIEVSGAAFGDGYHAVDVKVARLAKSGTRTQSRVTLYTGNTYFRYPTLAWPGTLRPFRDYASHLDIVAVYRFNAAARQRVEDLELITHQSWRIASRQRSSTTREYIRWRPVARRPPERAGRVLLGAGVLRLLAPISLPHRARRAAAARPAARQPGTAAMSTGARRRQDPETTRRVMQANKKRDTRPELMLRHELHRRGLRYRLHAQDVPGRPDLVIRHLKIAVFVDGDFWHGNRWRLRGLARLEDDIASNHEYWVPKIKRNIARDQEVTSQLSNAGWTVVRIWENEVHRDVHKAADRVERAVRAARRQSCAWDPRV